MANGTKTDKAKVDLNTIYYTHTSTNAPTYARTHAHRLGAHKQGQEIKPKHLVFS